MSGFARRLGDRVRQWFAANTEHVTLRFFPEPDAEPLVPDDGYVRLWLAEGFLAKAVTWGNHHFPALHGGVTLTFANQTTPFTRFTKPTATLTAPGAYLDYPMTSLLPYSGGTVEVEAALYRATQAGPLAAAVEVGSSLAALMGPPLSVAANIADKLSDGIDAVLGGQAEEPMLGLHHTLVAAGGGGQVLRPGHLVVVGAPPAKVPPDLRFEDGRLHGGAGLLTGFDYLVLRVECRDQHDELRLPHLDELLRRATEEWLAGHEDRFADLRTTAIADAVSGADLIPRDRFRLAKYVASQMDKIKEFGAAPSESYGFDPLPVKNLPSAEEVAHLTLADLLR